MANEQKFAKGSTTTVISLTASLADDDVAGVTGATELDNTTDKYPMAQAVFNNPDTFGAAPDDRSVIELLMVRKDVDGTDDDTSTPAGTDIEGAEHVGNFLIYNTDEEQRNTFNFSILGVEKANFFIRNLTGQTITYTSGPITVKITPMTIGT